MSGKTQYCYIKADPDHQDLEDIFKGKYIENRKEWRFEKSQEDEVTRFLYCSSSESEEGLQDKFARSDSEDEDLEGSQISDKVKELLAVKRRQRDRLHRANSFNASDDSDEEHESIDGRYRRSRPTRQKITADVGKLKKEVEKMQVDENKTVKK
ncbi:hypothetical protein [carnivorous sponge associated iridovirus]|jgi:hypothetical protein|nr:hypothetical protein [carnivorous sponge associated iridovirus]